MCLSLIYGICVANETDWRGICQFAVLLHRSVTEISNTICARKLKMATKKPNFHILYTPKKSAALIICTREPEKNTISDFILPNSYSNKVEFMSFTCSPSHPYGYGFAKENRFYANSRKL
jgi:hypothetical protein